MSKRTGSDSVSWSRKSVLWIGALALLNYWPIVFGRVPLPAEIVTQFPPWETVRGPDWRPPKHAEMGDLVTELYPWKAYTRRAVSEGSMPLWNPHLLLGAPFVGDLQTALFYPPHLLFYVLPTPLAWSLSFVVRTILAGWFATLLARALGAGRAAALLCGVIFAFSGWVTAFQTRPHLDTAVWLALGLFGIDRLQRRADGASVVLVAIAFSMPVVAGQPESAAHVTAVGLLFFAHRFAFPPASAQTGGPGRLGFAALFAAGGLLALGLAAVQMLPGLEFIGQLDRGFGLFWGPKPLHEAGAFLSRDLGATPNSAGVPIPESAAYTGMLTLLLAPLALFHRNRRDVVFFVVLVACVLQMVYGRGPVYALTKLIPVLYSIPNGRLLAVADLGLAVLAALGLSALQERTAGDRRSATAWWILSAGAFAVCAAGVAVVLARARPRMEPFLSLWTLRRPEASAAFLLLAAVLLALILAGRIPRERIAGAALAFCVVDLWTASHAFIPFAKPAKIFPPNPTFAFLKADPAPHRVASVDATYGASFELPYGLDSATGFTVVLRRTTRLLSSLGFEGHAPRLLSAKVVEARDRLLDLMNVKYVVSTTWNRSAENLASRPDRFRLAFSDGSVRVYENMRVLPRAFLVPAGDAEVIPRESSQLARLRDSGFDPGRSVVLAAHPPASPSSGEAPAASSVDDVRAEINEVRLRAAAAVPSILVLSQAYYPGWKAEVDGREVPVLRVDYGFAGLSLSAGTHDVRFVYRPRSLRLGAITSAATLLVVAVMLVRSRRSALHRAPR